VLLWFNKLLFEEPGIQQPPWLGLGILVPLGPFIIHPVNPCGDGEPYDTSWYHMHVSQTISRKTPSDDMIFIGKMIPWKPKFQHTHPMVPLMWFHPLQDTMGWRAFSPARLMSSLNRPGNGKPPRNVMGVAQFTDGFEWKIPRKKKRIPPLETSI
jgi:hypothetical protein